MIPIGVGSARKKMGLVGRLPSGLMEIDCGCFHQLAHSRNRAANRDKRGLEVTHGNVVAVLRSLWSLQVGQCSVDVS